MATVQDVIDSTIVRFQDPDETQFNDAELLSYCQNAVDYLNQCLINRNDISNTKDGSITTVAATETYLLSALTMTDYIAMYRGSKLEESGVWIDDNFLLPVRETERVSYTSTDDGEPLYYYVTGTSIGLLPVPDAVYTVSLKYFYKQPTLTAESTMPFNDVFNGAISTFISSMAAARIEQDISNIIQLYNELERQAFGTIGARTPIRPRMVNRRR